MERNYVETEIIPLNVYANDFGIIDFVDETNFDQFIDLIRDENETNPIVNFTTQGYEHRQHSNNILDHQDHLFSPTTPIDLFDFVVATNHINNVINTSYSVLDEFQDDADEEIMDGKESSATTTTNTLTKKRNNKVDRSRTLVSEQKRRSRMKEKLYALRSLVPNITKMDKASIVGDAVLYVKDLQMRAKKLKLEIAGIESSLKGDNNTYKGRTTQGSNKIMNVRSSYSSTKKIYKMDVIQLEEKAFYVRIVSDKEKGVAVFIYKALESLTNINVRSSNLSASAENYVLNFTLHIIDQEMDLSLPNLKLWIASVFHNLGFDFEESP